MHQLTLTIVLKFVMALVAGMCVLALFTGDESLFRANSVFLLLLALMMVVAGSVS